MDLSAGEALRRARTADHGVLSTLRADGRIDAVPACFVLADELLAIPIDRLKPKRRGQLQRVRNLEVHPEATFLCERWDADDWSRLWWVRLRLRHIAPDGGTLARLERQLRTRYAQYETADLEGLLVFRVDEVRGWSAT